MFVTIPLLPSVVRDESELAAKPYYIDSLNMRSVSGKMETTYGQELVTSTALTGVCRGIYAWADLNRAAWAAFGTHLRLKVMDGDGILYENTPVIERGQLINPFTTSSGSTTITVLDDAHGVVVDQLVSFSSAAVGGITISGGYPVSSVGSSSGYTFTASSVPSTSTSAGGTVDYEYSLKPGSQSSLGGLGYGTGGYGSGGYGGSQSNVDLDARTWSFANWGQNLIANPAWGGIYEWAPNITASELVTGGDFSSTASWVFGSGWSLGVGVSSAVNAAKLTQAVTLIRSSWHLLRFDVPSVLSGTIMALIGTSTIGAAIASSGVFKRAFFSPVATSQTLTFDGSSAFNGTLDNVSLKVLTTANLIPTAPSSAGSIFITAERNLVACGTINANTGILDPMRVQWSAAENNQDWTASGANVAGGYTLSHGSRIVRGMAGNRENLIFTDTAVYRMRSVPDPGTVYAFDLLGEGCGLTGPNAVVQSDGVFYWISKQGGFYQYAGGMCTPLQNPSQRDFHDNLSDVQDAKIYAVRNASQNEIWWFYPDGRDGIECSRYHVYDYVDRTWVSGMAPWTAQVDAGVYAFPIGADPNGAISFKEKDFSSDGSARSTLLETSYFNLGQGEGEIFATVMGVRPDFDDLRGGAQITFYAKNYPQDPAPRTFGPYNITAATKRLSVRIKGRQIKYRISTFDSPSFYRVGGITFDLKPSGQKK